MTPAQAPALALVVKDVQPALQSMLTGFEMMALHGPIIEQQPDFSLSLLPTLPEDQALLRQHVADYESKVGLASGVLNCFQGVRSTASHVLNMARVLEPVTARLDKGPDLNRTYAADLERFQAAMEELSRVTTSLNPNDDSIAAQVAKVQHDLTAFRNSQIEDDVVRFKTGVKEAKYSGQIDTLKSQIANLLGEMNDLNQDIASGATSQIPQALAFGFAVGKTIATSTATGKLVVGVAFAIYDEIEKANAFSKEVKAKNEALRGKIEQYRGLIGALLGDEQQMAVLLTIATHAEIYAENLEAVTKSVADLLQAYASLRRGFEGLALVDVPPRAGFFSAQLQAAQAFWTEVETTTGQALQLARSS